MLIDIPLLLLKHHLSIFLVLRHREDCWLEGLEGMVAPDSGEGAHSGVLDQGGLGLVLVLLGAVDILIGRRDRGELGHVGQADRPAIAIDLL